MTLVLIYSYFHVKSSWKSFTSERTILDLSETIKKEKPLPVYFYELYSVDNSISLNNNHKKYLLKNLFELNKSFESQFSTPPSQNVAKYVGVRIRENRDRKKQRRDYLFYEFSLTWKLEGLTNQYECLNWLARNYEFVYDNKGVEDASLYFYQKTLEELDTLEMASMVIMMRNPSLFNPVRRDELVKTESLKLIDKLERIKEQ